MVVFRAAREGARHRSWRMGLVLAAVAAAVVFGLFGMTKQAYAVSDGWTRCGGGCEWRIEGSVLTVRPLDNAETGTFSEPYATWVPEEERFKVLELRFEGTIEPVSSSSFFTLVHASDATRTISGLGNIDTSKVATMAAVFSLPELTALDVSSLDTSRVTDMSYMFAQAKKLREIDLSGMDTSRVRTMEGMFSGCSSLQSLDLTSFDTKNVTDMGGSFRMNYDGYDGAFSVSLRALGGMFAGCSSLSSIDVSTFDIGNVQDTRAMFAGCGALESLDLSSFNGTVLTAGGYDYNASQYGMSPYLGMFSDCSSLVSLQVGGIRVVDKAAYLFRDCTRLAVIPTERIVIDGATDIEGIFRSCYALGQVDVSSWDVSRVKNFSNAFSYCRTLESIDLSSWNMDSATTVESMFESCGALSQVRIPATFIGNSCQTVDRLFAKCPLLTTIPEDFTFGANFAALSKDGVFYLDPTPMYDYCDISTLYEGSDQNVVNYNWGADNRGLAKGVLSGHLDISGFASMSTSLHALLSPDSAIEERRLAYQWFVSSDPSGADARPIVYWGYLGREYATDPEIYFGTTYFDEMRDELIGNYVFCRAVDSKGEYAGVLQTEIVGPMLASNDISCDKDALAAVIDAEIGEQVTIDPVVTCEGTRLRYGVDYEVTPRVVSEPGAYTVCITGKYPYDDEVLYNCTVRWIADEPRAEEGLVYSGQTQMGVVAGEGSSVQYDDASAVDAGTYEATVSLSDYYVWRDGSSEDKRVSWSIAPAKLLAVYEGEEIVWGQTPNGHVGVSGFVEGENPNNVDQFRFPEVQIPDEIRPGMSYEIAPSGGHAPNYEFIYVPNVLEVRFSDVGESSWMDPWVASAVGAGLMGGIDGANRVPTGRFDPDTSLTRAQAILVIYRAATGADPSEPLGENETPLTDIAPGECYYARAVNWAYDNGIVTGDTDGGRPLYTFRPDAPVSRQDLAVMVWRAAGEPGATDNGAAYAKCADAGTEGIYATSALKWAASAGVITGVETGSELLFNAQQSALRSHGAKIFTMAKPYL